jgi:hypothetical protein
MREEGKELMPFSKAPGICPDCKHEWAEHSFYVKSKKTGCGVYMRQGPDLWCPCKTVPPDFRETSILSEKSS